MGGAPLPTLLANENWPRPALLALRAAGVEVESVSETMPAASDRAVLDHAQRLGRWIITFDRDYGELVFSQQVAPPPAIIFLRQGAFDAVWPAHAVLEVLKDPVWALHHLVVVSGRSVRRRALPGATAASSPR